MRKIFFTILAAVHVSAVIAAFHTVENGGSIQSAIDGTAAGDTVQVAAGNYTGPIRIEGRNNIVLLGGYPGRGNFSGRDPETHVTVIEAMDSTGTAVVLHSTRHSAVDGFTVTGGRTGIVIGDSWSAVLDHNTVANCVVTRNGVPGETMGGGLKTAGDATRILNCRFSRNHGGWAVGMGSAIYAGADSVQIENCTIDSNISYGGHGAAVLVSGTGCSVTGCIIDNNTGGKGVGYGPCGGIMMMGSVRLSWSIISNNYAPGSAAGVFLDGGEAWVDHCLIYGNESLNASYPGVGILADNEPDGSPTDIHVSFCTVANNIAGAPDRGAGLAANHSRGNAVNCIFWGNSHGDDFKLTADPDHSPPDTIIVNYCISQEAWPGIGNIHDDPLFADTAAGDFHLLSESGRWDPDASAWVYDPQTSPGIDAGDPADDHSLEPADGSGERVNMGYYGNTSQASKSGAVGVGAKDVSGAGMKRFCVSVGLNPYSPRVRIVCSMPAADNEVNTVSAEIYDPAGALLVHRRMRLSRHIAAFEWDAASRTSGTYFALVRAGEYAAVRKFVLVR